MGWAWGAPGRGTTLGTLRQLACGPLCVSPQVIAPDQVRKGFMAAIEAMDDLRLDVPDVVDQLALFICRWAASLAAPRRIVLVSGTPRGAASGRAACEAGAAARLPQLAALRMA